MAVSGDAAYQTGYSVFCRKRDRCKIIHVEDLRSSNPGRSQDKGIEGAVAHPVQQKLYKTDPPMLIEGYWKGSYDIMQHRS